MTRKKVNASEVVAYWVNKKNSFRKFIDLNEPTCWACGQGWEGRYDIITADFSKAWSKSPLQVCHVIPKSMGGNEKPSNLVLMCKECHDLAPNTTIPEIMYL